MDPLRVPVAEQSFRTGRRICTGLVNHAASAEVDDQFRFGKTLEGKIIKRQIALETGGRRERRGVTKSSCDSLLPLRSPVESCDSMDSLRVTVAEQNCLSEFAKQINAQITIGS